MSTDEHMPLRLLNDFLYCPRRCALHQLEGLWQNNAFTVAGLVAHEHADNPGFRNYLDANPGHPLRVERALPLFSHKLNLGGKADIVEFHVDKAGGPDVPLPVDYKLGRRRKWDNDDVQLCAQALCLEEMFTVAVPVGAVYHVATRRRRTVSFDAPLRDLTLRTMGAVRRLLADGVVPPAEVKPQCGGCSLQGICLPHLTSRVDLLDQAYLALFRRDSTGDRPTSNPSM